MKKLLFKTIFLAALLWLAACNKSDRDSVSGYVLEYGTDKPIEGATVKLYGWGGEPLSGGFAYTVDSAVTDADGYYRFEDDGQFALSMTANAKKDLYWTDYESERVVADGSYDNTDIHLKPYAWLRVKVINNSGAYSYYGPNSEYNNGNVLEFQIPQNDSIEYIVERLGNIERSFVFGFKYGPDGPFLQNYDSVSCFTNGTPTPIINGLLANYLNLNPIGHDTTILTIIF